MKYNPDLHNRHSIRLRGYNYANSGGYFVTICLNQRISGILRGGGGWGGGGDVPMQIGLQQKGQTRRSAPTVVVTTDSNFDFPTFGVVENGVMILNDCGKMIEKYILEIVNNTDKFSNVKIDEYIVMPDHIHAIIEINNNVKPIELPTIIQWFKTMTTNEYANNVKTINWMPFRKRLWQRNYYEYIIRNETIYARIAEYIRKNPILWRKKKLHLHNLFKVARQ
jgi:REP element-mobilizing transposase RayT